MGLVDVLDWIQFQQGYLVLLVIWYDVCAPISCYNTTQFPRTYVRMLQQQQQKKNNLL